MKKLAICYLLFAICSAANAAELSGMASVNVTSDTAANAKNMALTEARRQIINEVLGQHASPAQVADAVLDASDAQLSGLVESTGIDGEKLSDTTYSADIKMMLDPDAAHAFLVENEIQNTLKNDAFTGTAGQSIVTVDLRGALREWIGLMTDLRASNITPMVRRISGSRVVIAIDTGRRAAFLNAVRAGGWQVSDSDGFLRIWK